MSAPQPVLLVRATLSLSRLSETSSNSNPRRLPLVRKSWVSTVGWLTFTWYTGAEGTFKYPLDDNAVVDPTKIGTQNYSVHLEKGQGRCVP